MTILSDAGLEFAREHLTKFADSDFFPPLFEYEAIWSNWAEFKTAVTQSNVAKLWLPSPLTLPAPKLTDTFRIVHQLDPLSAIAYTTLAHDVAKVVEEKRIAPEDKVACSYRISIDNGAFFSDGTGYADFLEVTRSGCESHPFLLTADISDFYNQIYSHRVRNALASADASLEHVAKDVEHVIHALGAEASKGIPTGPNASIIFSEAIFIDIDQALLKEGYKFCRYVDDIRIFGESEPQLRKASEFLGEYLFVHHRLHLSAAKTRIWESKPFLDKEFFNHYTLAVQEAFKVLGSVAYGGVASVIHWGDEEDEDEEGMPFGILVATEDADPKETISQIVERVEKTIADTGRCDLNLLKALLRKSRIFNDGAYLRIYNSYPGVFLPVFHEHCKTMRQLVEFGLKDEVIKFARNIYSSEFIGLKFVRYWSDWLATQSADLLEGSGAHDVIRATGDMRHKASAAIISKDLAWVRAHRGQVDQLGEWDARAMVQASRILSKDERGPFLRNLERKVSGRDIVTEILIKYVLAMA
ncbi:MULTISPECIES: RNA-directed DNA polymerase [unclassified Brevundimonas]|uniref:RNA-directed DNA polymerase n=1 Tax=unclassified Brevundimonas TaxID=2622653 RepID=UPI0025C2642B|nr:MULTISPECIES: RNA-directed DNA polymerase [unclassified Brevundimonas]